MMEFKHPLERWHKIREFAKMLEELAAWHELEEIRHCSYYWFDSDASEEGCINHVTDLDNPSETVCWKCPDYDDQRSGGTEA